MEATSPCQLCSLLMVKVMPVGCRKSGKRKPKVRGQQEVAHSYDIVARRNQLKLHVLTLTNLKILSKKASSGVI